MNLRLKSKLKQAGFSHIVLPLAVLAVGVGVVAFAGTRIMGSSSAASPNAICGTGYSKKSEHYLKNSKTGEKAHFKVIVAEKGQYKCVYTLGTDAAATETNKMGIDLCTNYSGDDCSGPTHQGRYKGRTPTIKWHHTERAKVSGNATRNGNYNSVYFFPSE